MITKEEWQSLTGSAGWSKYKQYMLDCRAQVMEGIARGRFSGEKLTEAILECQLSLMHTEISIDQINKFYEVDDEPRQTDEPTEQEPVSYGRFRNAQ